MASWGAIAGVTARLTYGTVSATSHPTTTEVTAWIDEAEAMARLTLNGVGIPTSSLSDDAKAVLKSKVEKYAEGQTRRAWASADGTGANDDGNPLIAEFYAFLADIKLNPSGWGQELGGGAGNTDTTLLRSHVTSGVTGPDGVTARTVSNGDFAPVMTRAEKF